MNKNLILLLLPIFLIGCKQKEEKPNNTSDVTINNKSLFTIDSTTSNNSYNYDEIMSINKLVYLKKDSTLVTGKINNYYDNGQVKQLKTFKDGKLDGLRKVWYENGQLMQEGTFKNGKIEGTRSLWFDTGELKAEGTYKDGNLDGYKKQWYKNGQLKSETNYKQGKLNGVTKQYTEDGQLKEEK